VSLKDYPLVYPAAGTDASGVPISYDRLLAICGGRECDVAADGE
jgi:prolyl-tRNA editing enzyme YbaK/EbsC (Cys-tRNA(Pro) deacylase)